MEDLSKEMCHCCNGTGIVEGEHYDDKQSCRTCNGKGFFEFNKCIRVSDMMQEIIAKIAKDLNKQKELVIKQKLKEVVGIDINLEEESLRRFKRLCVISEGNQETVYFNDGSIEGKRIVTFVKKDVPFNSKNFSLGYEETYY